MTHTIISTRSPVSQLPGEATCRYPSPSHSSLPGIIFERMPFVLSNNSLGLWILFSRVKLPKMMVASQLTVFMSFPNIFCCTMDSRLNSVSLFWLAHSDMARVWSTVNTCTLTFLCFQRRYGDDTSFIVIISSSLEIRTDFSELLTWCSLVQRADLRL